MKEILREMLSEFHKEALPDLIKRNIAVPQLPHNIRKALVFIGMRRVGKTYLMYQQMQNELAQGLAKNKIIYINFEDDRLENFEVKDFQTILDVYFELYPEFTSVNDLCFYFDEIQNITGWEKFIRRLIDKEKMSLYITGSSAKLLSKEIATSLRGRCLTQEVFPLSFLEYLSYKEITNFGQLTSKEKSTIKHYCQIYLAQGGFPETLDLSDSLRRQTIQSYVSATVFRDVIERHKLSNPHVIKLFLTYCLQNIAAPLSITKVYNTFKSRGETLGRASLYAYFDYFEDAYLLCGVSVFELSARKRQVNPKKIYCIDTSIITAYSIKPQMEYGTCLENAVYIHLRKKEYDEIYYYKTESGKEIDFAAQTLNGKVELIQVCLNLTDEKTKQREVSALIEATSELELNEAWIITADTADTWTVKNITIHVVPYWQWALLPV
jgi:predicted AAA+ superfamily ATPase